MSRVSLEIRPRFRMSTWATSKSRGTAPPMPTPSVNRPPERTSTVAEALASWNGVLNGTTTTAVPSLRVVVFWATAERRTKASMGLRVT